MRRTHLFQRAFVGGTALACLCVLLSTAAPALKAQTSPKQQDQAPPPEPERSKKLILIGLKVRGFPYRKYSPLANRTMQQTVASPLAEFNYETNSRTRAISGGVNAELRMGRHLMLRGEFIWQPLRYNQYLNLFKGTARTLDTVVERTNANAWDIPVMLQYRPRARSGVLKNMYFGVGETLRKLQDISTSTGTTPSGGDTTFSSTPAPYKENVFGTCAAVGFRWIDDVGINLTPEIRYTRWGSQTFSKDSTQSTKNQFEIGLSLTF